MSDSSRRDFVKKAMYVAPVVLTLAAAPEYAKAGSDKDKDKDKDKKEALVPVTDARWLG